MNRKRISDALDAAVIPGFSRIGYAIRSRSEDWQQPSPGSMSGKVVVITGPTSGLGLETARSLSVTGAHLVLVARQRAKADQIADELRTSNSQLKVTVVECEMGDLASVARASMDIRTAFPRVDVLIHNAGALLNDRKTSPQGIEQTIASHVVGPFLMTAMLRDVLRAANGRVVTVSSGGMYTASLPQLHNGESLELTSYNGSKQYAVAKRVQVTLNEMWAHEEPNVSFVAMHPGWADTPGVQDSLPLFRILTKPILRTPREGADTIIWLATVGSIPASSGTFWCDREVRSIHKSSQTKRSDSPDARRALWEWCTSTVQPFW